MLQTIRSLSSRTILNRQVQKHFGFDYSLNPYRGCSHACRYCYARETHTVLELNIGEDFEQQIFVKEGLSHILTKELKNIPDHAMIALGTATDPYQPVEGRFGLTRQALVALNESGHPFSITTKSPLILRDLDLLKPMGQRKQCYIHISLTSTDKPLLQAIEPGTSSPTSRLQLISELQHHLIPVGVFAAPLIPGLTDSVKSIDSLFAALKIRNVQCVMVSTTRLSPVLRPYFREFLSQYSPERLEDFDNLYRGSFPKDSYLALFNRRVALAYQKYGLSRHFPRPLPYRTQEQAHFPF